MASTLSTHTGVATDSLMRCITDGYLSNPMNGRELRRQAERDRKRDAKKAAKA